MKKSILMILSLLFFISCNERFTGTLSLNSDLKIKQKNGEYVYLTDGKYTIDLQYGVFGIESPKMVIFENGNKLASVSVKRELFWPFNGNFDVKYTDLKQDFSIKGKVVPKNLSVKRVVKQNAPCIYLGKCTGIVFNRDKDGNLISTEKRGKGGYGLCRGTRWEHINVVKNIDEYKVKFINKYGKTIGTFAGLASKPYVYETVVSAGSCIPN